MALSKACATGAGIQSTGHDFFPPISASLEKVTREVIISRMQDPCFTLSLLGVEELRFSWREKCQNKPQYLGHENTPAVD